MNTYLAGDADGRNELEALGVSEAELLEAIRRGQYFRDQTNPFHPSSYPGTRAWAETRAALCELYVPKGWTAEEPGNLPLIISPDGEVAIVVSSGSQEVGEPDKRPKTRNTKGFMTVDAINVNRVQLRLDLPDVRVLPGKVQRVRALWILLLYREEDVVKAELSLPQGLTAGVVDQWAKRIILPAMNLASARQPVPAAVDEGPEIVPVVRRKS